MRTSSLKRDLKYIICALFTLAFLLVMVFAIGGTLAGEEAEDTAEESQPASMMPPRTRPPPPLHTQKISSKYISCAGVTAFPENITKPYR